MVTVTSELGPITAIVRWRAVDSGSDRARFCSSTMPCRAASRASCWWAGVQTSFGPRFPKGCLDGSPSNMPNRIWTVSVWAKAPLTSASLSFPARMADSVWIARKGPQSKSKPAQNLSKDPSNFAYLWFLVFYWN